MMRRWWLLAVLLFVCPDQLKDLLWACDQDEDSCSSGDDSGPCDDSPLNVCISTGNDGSQCPGAQSDHPIRYLDGVPIIHTDGIRVPSVGGGWSFYLRYLNRVTPDGGGIILDDAGYNWLTSTPKLMVRSGQEPDLWLQKGSGQVIRFSYDRGGGAWINVTGSYLTVDDVTYDSTNCYVVEDKRGGKAYFYRAGYLQGQPYKFIDVNGNEIVFSYYDSGHDLYSYKLKSIYTGTSGYYYEFWYTSATGFLSQIRLKLGGSSGSLCALMSFGYYISTLADKGSVNDLKFISVRNYLEEQTSPRVTWFRYYTTTGTDGRPHDLKYVIGPHNYEVLRDIYDVAWNLDELNDSAFDNEDPQRYYFDYKFKYHVDDEDPSIDGRVKQEIVRTGGCGCGGASNVIGTYEFLDYDVAGTRPSDFNTPYVRVKQKPMRIPGMHRTATS